MDGWMGGMSVVEVRGGEDGEGETEMDVYDTWPRAADTDHTALSKSWRSAHPVIIRGDHVMLSFVASCCQLLS